MYKQAKGWLASSPPRALTLGFVAIILVGAILLKLPISLKDGQSIRWIDALFTSVSATCVTGLVVVDTGTFFSVFGHWVILVLVQIGGVGFMTMGTLFALFLRRKVSLKERLILQESLNQNNLEGIIRLVRRVINYALTIELAGSLLFTLRFMLDMPPGRALYYGIFHGVSIFNNAGFDLFGDYRSMSNYISDPFVNILSIILIILGGLGFVVLADLVEYRRNRRLSLHSKVAICVTLLLFVVGAIVILLFEFTNEKTLGPLGTADKIFAALLHSMTPRSAGITTIDVSSLRQATQFLLVILMFIGVSPGSTGGGIKTTTFAVLIVAVLAVFRGREDVVLLRHTIERERVYKAITVTLFSFLIVVAGTMLLSVTENHTFMGVLFESTSAFATVGLSTGLTPELTDAGKLILILLMFMGRLGPFTLFYAVGPKHGRPLYRHAEGKIIIG
ncbi:TrkH family potassium uptake protein [Cohnella fermenti]|uniref:Trk family potassium uptake protein n=1 Tax=Cohnella fermenti TaxID=2565925 RepID=A0A4S4BRW5_9BACL|nr:TrkH family potassium uptake protein [Cohnella fermenti]THF76931.1 Trk family potassium uptake protein [Cohnella fermenti]